MSKNLLVILHLVSIFLQCLTWEGFNYEKFMVRGSCRVTKWTYDTLDKMIGTMNLSTQNLHELSYITDGLSTGFFRVALFPTVAYLLPNSFCSTYEGSDKVVCSLSPRDV